MENSLKKMRRHWMFLFFFLGMSVGLAMAQGVYPLEKVVHGTIVDENGDPMPGASISLRDGDGKWGGVSDLDGNFSIRVPENIWNAGRVRMEVSYLGYETEHIQLKKEKTSYRIQMQLAASELDEVVVTGYQVLDRRKTTSAISSVKMEDVLEPGMTSIAQASPT